MDEAGSGRGAGAAKGAILQYIAVSQRTFLEDFRRKINLQIHWKCSEAATATKSITAM